MILSLSCRTCEGFLSKEEATMPFRHFAELAATAGFKGICMRASQIGVQTPKAQVREAQRILEELDLRVTMVTGDFDIVYNNARGPDCLKRIDAYLDLAEQLNSNMLRVCLKTPSDIPLATVAAEKAAQRDMHLVHQCHAESLFETVDGIVNTLQQIDHPNFGLVYEAANLEECGQDYGSESITRLAPWIRNVYLQNQQLSSDGNITLNTWCRGPVSFDVIPIPQAGGINFPAVFRGLKEIGYDGLFTVHQSGPEPGQGSPEDSAKATASYLKELMRGIS